MKYHCLAQGRSGTMPWMSVSNQSVGYTCTRMGCLVFHLDSQHSVHLPYHVLKSHLKNNNYFSLAMLHKTTCITSRGQMTMKPLLQNRLIKHSNEAVCTIINKFIMINWLKLNLIWGYFRKGLPHRFYTISLTFFPFQMYFL